MNAGNEWNGPERRRENQQLVEQLRGLVDAASERIAQLDEHQGTFDEVRATLVDTTEALDRVNATLRQTVPRDELHAVGSSMNRRRRFGIVWLAFAMVCAVQVGDLHNEACGPGARTEKVVQAIIHGDVRTEAEFRAVVDRSTPNWFCEASFPTHTHDPNRPWPTTWNGIGIALYCLLAAAGLWFAKSWRHDPVVASSADSDPNKEDQT